MKNNTILGVDLKTQLQVDGLMKPGKDYRGILRRDYSNEPIGQYDEHLTFVESLPSSSGRRNPKVFEGQHLSVTRREDGSPRINVKNIKLYNGFSIESYAFEVANELVEGLESFVEEA